MIKHLTINNYKSITSSFSCMVLFLLHIIYFLSIFILCERTTQHFLGIMVCDTAQTNAGGHCECQL